MKTILERRLLLGLSLATLAVLGNGLSVQAETVNPGNAQTHESRMVQPLAPLASETTTSASSPRIPIPGTTATSVAAINTGAALTPQVANSEAKTVDSKVAQLDDVDPGQATRGGSSYIGVAGNIGLGGDESSSLGDANFMVISKIGLTNVISVRPSVVLGDNTTILVPATYDLAIRSVDEFTEPLPIAPYIGGGIAISTGDNSEVGPMLSAGLDVPIGDQFTATAGVNAAFLDGTDVGLLLGVGYNFSGLDL